VALSAHNHTRFITEEIICQSTDRGDNWTRLGGDMTTGVDRNKLQIFGEDAGQGQPCRRHDGVQEYPTTTMFSESPLTPNGAVGGDA